MAGPKKKLTKKEKIIQKALKTGSLADKLGGGSMGRRGKTASVDKKKKKGKS